MRFLDLGSLQIEGEGGSRPVKGRLAAVLATLLLHLDRRVPVDLLVDAVWGDGAAAQSANTLETHVWRLRRLLEPGHSRGESFTVLLNDAGGYRLTATSAQVDSARFEQLNLDVLTMLTSGQPDRALRAVDEALQLWRGEPFEALAERDWAQGPVARLVETRAQLQERRVTALLELGQPDQAVVELEPLLLERPLHERLWGQRMVALHQLGRTDEALRTYRTARRTLLDQVGLDPGHELSALEQAILRDDVLLRGPRAVVPIKPAEPVIRLPRRRALVGRSEETTQVRRLLVAGHLVTVVGAAGSGKTALATEVARAAAPAFPDGVWFVDLSTADQDSDVAMLVATALDLTVSGATSATAALMIHSADRRALLVLDNCEQVLDQVARLVDRLTEPTQQVSLLTTSREPLNLPAERVFPLSPLAFSADRGRDDEPIRADEAAVTLFLAAARLDEAQVSAQLRYVRRICRAVDGLPLAIELAAGVALTYSLEEIAEDVESDPGQLASIGRGVARHHQTLWAAVERSYGLLDPQEQLLHRRLAVLPGSFGREVAQAVAGHERVPHLSSLLARLVHSSLLATSYVEGRTQFHQLAPIRAHAAHVLRTKQEVAIAEGFRDAWVQDLVAARPRGGTAAEADWYATVRRDLPAVRATLRRRLEDPDDTVGPRLVADLFGFWYYQDLLEEGIRWAEAAAARDHPDVLGGVLVRLVLGGLLATQSRGDRSRRIVIDALGDIGLDSAGDVRLAGLDRPLRRPEELDLGALMLGVAATFSIPRDAQMIEEIVLRVERAGLVDGDVDLELVQQAVASLIRVIADPEPHTLDVAASVFERAAARENLWAGFLAASCASSVALTRRDALLGQLWSRRVIDFQGRLGARTMMAQVETLGDFLALDAQFVPAVKIFSATHLQARRVGHPWPRNLITLELMGRCQAQLSGSAFDSAWAEGQTLKREQLLASTG